MVEEKEDIGLGVAIFGMIFIITSLWHMHVLLSERDWYFTLYRSMPHWLMIARYCFSWLQRILGLIAGIGIIFHIELCRKLIIAISAFAIATISWKHPYTAYIYHAEYLDQHFMPMLRSMGVELPSFSSVTIHALIVQRTIDVIFFSVLIYYFTRPDIKALFNRENIGK